MITVITLQTDNRAHTFIIIKISNIIITTVFWFIALYKFRSHKHYKNSRSTIIFDYIYVTNNMFI